MGVVRAVGAFKLAQLDRGSGCNGMGRSGEGALTGGAECAAIAIGNKCQWIDKGEWLEKVQRGYVGQKSGCIRWTAKGTAITGGFAPVGVGNAAEVELLGNALHRS